MKPIKPNTAVFKSVTYLSLGTVISVTNTRLTEIIQANDDGTFTGRKHLFSHSKNLHPCGIFSIPTAFDNNGQPTQLRASEAEYIKPLDDLIRSTKIRIQHQANETQLTAHAQAKKAKADNSTILETLKPLRTAWQNTNPVGRLALEVRLLNYLRNGKDL